MKQQFSKTISAAMLAAALLLGASAAFAQVKIGTNPTTIGASNNLEVEASTTGRKTSVDKVTGQVTIADGTEASGDVFTSDANGGGSWRPVIQSMAIATATTPTPVPASTNTTINFGAFTFDRGGNFSLATDMYTAPTTGIYYVKCTVGFPQVASLNQLWISLWKSGVQYADIFSNPAVPANTAAIGSGNTMLFLMAGETVRLTVTSNAALSIVSANVEIANLSN
jgi:hypothetical protein